MSKNYILFVAAISVFKFSSAQTLSSAPTLTFTNDTGISTDNIASDGDGGSVNISDINIQIYTISDVNGAIVTPLSWENASYYGAGTYTGITANMATGRKGMAIKSENGSEFKLNQFQYLNWGESQAEGAVNTIKGFKNGIEVASTTFQGYNNPFLPNTIVLTTAFDDVDEVRFYISAGGYEGNQNFTNHSINSIQVSTPVLNANSFELNSKLNIYPNPTSNNVTVELLTNEISTLEVYDVSGKFLFTESLNKEINTINIEKLSSGIYFFKVSSSKGISTNKIVKN
ncbi:T9SS type A sorting domain-containing protein [Flavobacterium terrigena]|uniref:Por secretion system C-terminal sorting domain-containing protein n=1 Tax=Flavobacterium terrigena TaxID=402734 RepID=A0A1H6SRK5_9FLAO|nr:T9SS type A sorting domain-containing protein [Flavobacterium terrigena]SEI66690.1 Por secretion system C-terminal sorting domain-containing protein [Flavobacterium terrigena]